MYITYVLCGAYLSNLVGTSGVKSCLEACHFFMLLEEVHTFFVKSTEKLRNIVKV